MTADKETMIERVAQAMLESKAWPVVFQAGSSVVLARAAIAAMREPTDKMICAALDAHDRAPKTTRIIDDWQVMIDAALKD